MKRLSSCARTYPAVGYKLYPWGARAPQSCPIDILWWGTAHETTRFSYYGNLHRDFSLNITLHHNVIETWGWAYFTQATNQTLRIIVTVSNHALATIQSTLATDHIDCHYKRPRWISLDHSVIEAWGWAHFTQTTNQTLTYPAVGYKLYPWGARAPQSCPIDILWWGTAHETARVFPTMVIYIGIFHWT